MPLNNTNGGEVVPYSKGSDGPAPPKHLLLPGTLPGDMPFPRSWRYLFSWFYSNHFIVFLSSFLKIFYVQSW